MTRPLVKPYSRRTCPAWVHPAIRIAGEMYWSQISVSLKSFLFIGDGGRARLGVVRCSIAPLPYSPNSPRDVRDPHGNDTERRRLQHDALLYAMARSSEPERALSGLGRSSRARR